MSKLSDFAEQHGLDKSAVECLMNYVVRMAEENKDEFLSAPDLFLDKAVRSWSKASHEFYSNMLYSTSDEWKTKRTALMHSVYEGARA
jgi:hypothetical protein